MPENRIRHGSFDIHRPHKGIIATLPNKRCAYTEDQASAQSDSKRDWIVWNNRKCRHLGTIDNREPGCMNSLADAGLLKLREQALIEISIGERLLRQHLKLDCQVCEFIGLQLLLVQLTTYSVFILLRVQIIVLSPLADL